MSNQTKPMTWNNTRRVHKFPCDGIPRFKIVGDPAKAGRTYSEAYEDLFAVTGCTMDEKKHRTFTREGMRRIIALNDRYTRIANAFLVAHFIAEKNKKTETTAPAPALNE